uniref:Uncharacterized protein n=1 Tax=Panagrolaimus sp. JU765 TaxID=591449 RepID=A0AC34Q0V2_9BILA
MDFYYDQDILEGSKKTESDLLAELSPHLLIVMKNEIVTGSAFQTGDLNNDEQISRLKLLADYSDFESDLENESSEENQAIEVTDSKEAKTAGSSESQTTSTGSEKSDKITSRNQKQYLSENLGSESTTITMNNEEYRSLKLEMAKLLKMDILLSNKALQPFVKTQGSNERILLGFGSHQNRIKPKTTEGSEMFVSPCPLECSIDERQWICVNCGEFFKIQGFQIICSCGTTHVTNLKLECFDPKHPKDFFPCEKHDPTSASISSSRRSSFSVIEDAQ